MNHTGSFSANAWARGKKTWAHLSRVSAKSKKDAHRKSDADWNIFVRRMTEMYSVGYFAVPHVFINIPWCIREYFSCSKLLTLFPISPSLVHVSFFSFLFHRSLYSESVWGADFHLLLLDYYPAIAIRFDDSVYFLHNSKVRSLRSCYRNEEKWLQHTQHIVWWVCWRQQQRRATQRNKSTKTKNFHIQIQSIIIIKHETISAPSQHVLLPLLFAVVAVIP